MPAINPRQECHCHSDPTPAGRFAEESVGWRPFVWLAVFAAALAPVHFYVWGWGWLAWLVLFALDLLWILVLVHFLDDRRGQSRFGLGYVRLDELSFTLGGAFTLHVGSAAGGLAGLRGLTVHLRCVDAVLEERDTGQGTERQRVCYVVWADERRMQADALPARGEASFQFVLPSEGDFAGPVGDHRERYWELEVVRHGGASPLRFRVLVYPPAPVPDQRPRAS